MVRLRVSSAGFAKSLFGAHVRTPGDLTMNVGGGGRAAGGFAVRDQFCFPFFIDSCLFAFLTPSPGS